MLVLSLQSFKEAVHQLNSASSSSRTHIDRQTKLITVPLASVRALDECLGRIQMSAENSKRISQANVEAFEKELDVLRDGRTFLKSLARETGHPL